MFCSVWERRHFFDMSARAVLSSFTRICNVLDRAGSEFIVGWIRDSEGDDSETITKVCTIHYKAAKG